MRLRHCCERLEHIGRAQDRSVGQEQLAELRDAAVQAGKALRTQLS